MMMFTIGKAARAAGVSVETIRFYERRGLISQPAKPQDGYRLYPAETVQRIRFIRKAQEIGFSLREIAELLSLRARPEGDCADVRDQAAEKIAEVNRKIRELKRVRSALHKVSASCPGRGDLRACTILEALQTSQPVGPELSAGDLFEDDNSEDRRDAVHRMRADHQGAGRGGARRESRRRLL